MPSIVPHSQNSASKSLPAKVIGKLSKPGSPNICCSSSAHTA